MAWSIGAKIYRQQTAKSPRQVDIGGLEIHRLLAMETATDETGDPS